MAYSYDPNLQAWQNYDAWVAAGKPNTDASGMQLDVRGAPMAPDAWSGVYADIANQGGAAGQAAYAANPTGAIPGYTPGSGNTLGGLASGNVAPAGYTGPMPSTPYVPGVQPGNVSPAGTNGGAPTSMPGVNVGPAPGPGQPGYIAPGGVGSIPGGQPNYPLDIGSYLNPLMGYALAQGVNSITNNAAAGGMLRSGNTLKELMQYGMGVGANNFNNAANIAQGQQAFAHNVDVNDRDFAYQSQLNDRNYNLNSLLAEAGMGLQGLDSTNRNAGTLADIISRNLLLQGQANAGGTIGGSNAITNAISQILAQGSGNQSLDLLRQLLGG